MCGGHVLCERDSERVSGARGVGVGERQRDGLPVQGGVLWVGRCGVRGVRGGQVQVGDGGRCVLELSGAHQLWRGEREHHQLHLCCGLQGGLGRCELHGVRGGDVQAGDGVWGAAGQCLWELCSSRTSDCDV